MNVEKIVRVLKAETEGLIAGTMAKMIEDCGHVGHCAIGALLAASGITTRRLESWGKLTLWTPVLEHDYGLTSDQSYCLMAYSDTSVDYHQYPRPERNRQERLDRLDKVIQYVRDMAVAS